MISAECPIRFIYLFHRLAIASIYQSQINTKNFCIRINESTQNVHESKQTAKEMNKNENETE